MKKRIFCLLMALLAALTTCASVAEDATENAPLAVIYSFEGDYKSSFSETHFHFVLNLYEDGHLEMTPGSVFYDLDDYDETASGTWTEEQTVLSFRIINMDGTFAKDYQVELLDGGYAFPLTLSLAGYQRPIDMVCVTEGFVPAGAEAEEAPAAAQSPASEEEAARITDETLPVKALFQYANESGSMTGAVTLYEDGTAKAEYIMASMNHTLLTLEGRWEETEGVYSVTLQADENNEETLLVSEEGQLHWVFKFAGGGSMHDADIVLTLAD